MNSNKGFKLQPKPFFCLPLISCKRFTSISFFLIEKKGKLSNYNHTVKSNSNLETNQDSAKKSTRELKTGAGIQNA